MNGSGYVRACVGACVGMGRWVGAGVGVRACVPPGACAGGGGAARRTGVGVGIPARACLGWGVSRLLGLGRIAGASSLR